MHATTDFPTAAPPSLLERDERTKAIWYAFGAIDTLRQTGSELDMLDAHNFAMLYGATHKVPGLQPTVAWAWLAYVDLRAVGVGTLSPERLAKHAATLAGH
jgi:hypothetical protein